MVPLTEQDGEEEEGPPNSATTFFALPQPKRKKKEEEPAAPAPAAGPPAAPPGPPPGVMPGMPPGMGSMPPGMMAPGMMAPGMGIQGPVASGPVASGAYPAANVPMGVPGEDEINRAQSYRVFAVVAGLMFMVFSALIVATGLTVWGIWYASDSGGDSRTAQVTQPVPPAPANRPVVDTGTPPPKPEPKPAPRKPSPGPKPAPKPAPPPPPAPEVGPAAATIKISPSEPFTSIEVNCPSGFRERAPFSGGVATVQNVPREDCVVTFKGGPPAKNKISGGQTKECSFPNSTAHCK